MVVYVCLRASFVRVADLGQTTRLISIALQSTRVRATTGAVAVAAIASRADPVGYSRSLPLAAQWMA